jgi:hypothetical protein
MKRVRDDKEIETEVMTAFEKNVASKRPRLHPSVAAYLNNGRVPQHTTLTKLLTDIETASIGSPYLLQWQYINEELYHCFFFNNKLVGQMAKLDGHEAISITDEPTLPADIVEEVKQIGTTLPFQMISFFIDPAHRIYMNMRHFRLFYFNRDKASGERIKYSNEPEGKLGYHPYLAFIDKFSLEFLKTGAFGPLFSGGEHVTSESTQIKNAMATINGFIFADLYPEEHTQHARATEIRTQIVLGVIQMLTDEEASHESSRRNIMASLDNKK